MKIQNLLAIGGILLLFGCGKPVANFMYSDSKTTAPVTIQFENKSEKAEEYEWDFGDGNFSNDESPTHEYSSSGNYLVVLKAKKGKKETSFEKRIVIDAPRECLVERITDYGNMVGRLYDETPHHRDNFSKVVE